jgi:hypothetical protein
VAWAFDGAVIYWITANAPSHPLDHLKISGSPVASTLSGAKVHWTFALFRFAHAAPAQHAPPVR